MTLFDWEHLRSVKMSYSDHLMFSLKNSLYLFCGSVLGVVHAFCPMVLVTVHSDTILFVGTLLKDSHGENPPD